MPSLKTLGTGHQTLVPSLERPSVRPVDGVLARRKEVGGDGAAPDQTRCGTGALSFNWTGAHANL